MKMRLQNIVARSVLAVGIIYASLLIVPSAIAGNGHSPSIFQPKAHPHGKSMAGWLRDFAVWRASGYPAQEATSGKVFLLKPLLPDQPEGAGTISDPLKGDAHAHITIKAGTPVLDVLVAWFAEIHSDGQVDPNMPDSFWGTHITGEVTLNGKTITNQIEDYYVPPQVFDPALIYPGASELGTIANVAIQGSMIMLKPLPVGVHTYVSVTRVIIPDETGATDGTSIIFRMFRTIAVVP
jgi:hypothetical protein